MTARSATLYICAVFKPDFRGERDSPISLIFICHHNQSLSLLAFEFLRYIILDIWVLE